jgi:hypothetical protein
MKISKILFVAITMSLLQGCSLHVMRVSDLRTEVAKANTDEAKAKTLIKEMGTAHGIENWKNINTYTVHFSDVFYGFMGKQAHNFKEDSVAFDISNNPQTID